MNPEESSKNSVPRGQKLAFSAGKFFYGLLFLCICIPAIVYKAIAHPGEWIPLRLVFWGATFFIGILVILRGLFRQIEHGSSMPSWLPRWLRKNDPMALVGMLLVPFELFAIFWVFLADCLFVAIKDLILWNKGGSVGVITVTVLGSLLFWLRLRFRSVYGVIEIMFGLAIAAQKTQLDDPAKALSSEWILGFITAGIYLFVRGVDNVHQGITKEPLDPIAGMFLKGLYDSDGPKKGEAPSEKSSSV